MKFVELNKKMETMLIVTGILLSLILPGSSDAYSLQPPDPEPERRTAGPQIPASPDTQKGMGDTAERARQECWSGRDCTGDMLNHKDRHNCKRSGGHSWRSRSGICTNHLN